MKIIRNDKSGKVLQKMVLVTVALAMLLFTMAGCSSSKEPTLEEIQLMTPVTKTEYLVDETFDPSGLVLVGIYSDGTRKEITDYSYDKTGPLTLDDTVVTITAGDYTFETPIKVITPAEQIILIAVNGVDTLEMYADGHLAAVGGGGGGSLEPKDTKWTWDGENLEIWLANYTPEGTVEDHLTQMNLVKNAVGDITFEYDVRGRWHINYTITAGSMEGVLTPDARYPIE